MRNFKEGNELSNSAEWEMARERYLVAKGFLDSLGTDTLTIKNQVINAQYMLGRIQLCDSIIPKKNDHLVLMSDAEKFQNNREYVKAMEKLNQAYELAYDRSGVKKNRDDLFKEATRVYQKDLTDYDDMKDLELENQTRLKIEKLNELYKINNR